jgi:mannose-6-phosphate isomerase-like protein (cupin superfamily)
MQAPRFASLAVLAILALAATLPAAAPAGAQGRQVIALAPKPTELTPYVEPHRPIWRLSEILSAHEGEESWSVTIVDDEHLRARYISMAPGESTPTHFYADNRAWWVVQGGQIRFTIDGQEPFVATKGFLVQVPYRVPFRMETVGDEPSLRFEVTVAGASVLYPADAGFSPEPAGGVSYVPVSLSGRGSYDERNEPYLDFMGEVVNGARRGGAFVTDDRGFANIIRGRGTPPPPDTNVGHFHLDYGEFWFVMEGQIDYLIEGIPFFSGQEGDIVYVPKGRYHRASYGGEGMATRLAINGYPQGLHNYPGPDPD